MREGDLKWLGFNKSAYGAYLNDCYVSNTSNAYEEFKSQIFSSISNEYLPVYRMADGEFRFLSGPRLSLRSLFSRNTLSFLKYHLGYKTWSTSWGEVYNKAHVARLRRLLYANIESIVAVGGKVACYYNRNEIRAFESHNWWIKKVLLPNYVKGGYIPFHFVQALFIREIEGLVRNKNVGVISGCEKDEQIEIIKELQSTFGAKNSMFYSISASNSMLHTEVPIFEIQPDIIFVAAGIGSANIILLCKGYNCPVIDVGGAIHLLSRRRAEIHKGFFQWPY